MLQTDTMDEYPQQTGSSICRSSPQEASDERIHAPPLNSMECVLFFFPSDKNWWLGSHQGPGGQISWSFVGNTAGFGDAPEGCPVWIGNFSRGDRAEVLLYCPGDDNWWLGTHDGSQLNWSLAGNTNGFGTIDTLPFWTGDFTGNGRTDLIFYYHGDRHWWLGSFAGTQLVWKLVRKPPPPRPNPPEPPTPQTQVPNVVDLMIDNASARLEAAKLRLGWLLNLTGEIRSERLKVTHQDPTGGTIVPEGTAVNLRVDLAQPPQGVKTLGLYNCNTDRRSLRIWVFESSTGWRKQGQLNPQYDASGRCPAVGSAPLELTFESGHLYSVVALDEGNTGCNGRNDPTMSGCQRWSVTNVVGDSNGQVITTRIS
jgi:hypothetical protein